MSGSRAEGESSEQENLGKGYRSLCLLCSRSSGVIQAQWGRPVLLPKPESDRSAHWASDLEVKLRIKFLPSDKGVVAWLPLSWGFPTFPSSRSSFGSLALLFSVFLFPSPPETVTLGGVGSQALCWPAATQLTVVPRQPVRPADADPWMEGPVRRSELCRKASRWGEGKGH